MSQHQYNFDIQIPTQVITEKKHGHIFYEYLENKVILGLIGYARSGKDTISKKFIDNYGYHRVAFADNIKIEMNKFFKEIVYEYLSNINNTPSVFKKDVEDGLLLEDKRALTLDMIDFQTEDISVKKRLRPFIIWYGEKLREINGPYYWINKAMEVDASGYDKIILSDVRREKELDIFMNSNSFNKRSEFGFVAAGFHDHPTSKVNLYSSLLFHVNQLGLTDDDTLTHECIIKAQENWLLDHTFYIDPRLPEKGSYRNNYVNYQIKEVAKKFGINKPDKTISERQTNMFHS